VFSQPMNLNGSPPSSGSFFCDAVTIYSATVDLIVSHIIKFLIAPQNVFHFHHSTGSPLHPWGGGVRL
jgi:hypothetical protein